MDLNADGHGDILSGSYADNDMRGLFQVLWGQGQGKFAKAETLNGTDGRPLLNRQLKSYSDEELLKLNASEVAKYLKDSGEQFMTRVAAADLDQDGHLDLVAGNSVGTFFLFDGKGKGQFTPKATRLTSIDGNPLKVNRKSDPCLFDWDEDGDLDIISGSEFGVLQMAENVGTPKKPAFQAFRLLVAGPKSYSRKGSRTTVFGDDHVTRPGATARVWVDDVNGDGMFDLLVGDYVALKTPADGVQQSEVPELMAAWNRRHAAQLKEIDRQRAKLSAEMMELYKPGEGEKNQQRLDAIETEMNQLGEREAPLYEERDKICREFSTGFVWVYYQVGRPAKGSNDKPAADTNKPATSTKSLSTEDGADGRDGQATDGSGNGAAGQDGGSSKSIKIGRGSG